MSATCPDAGSCEFYQSVYSSAVLRIKYASMYPYCKAGKYESCMRWWMMRSGRQVPSDLLPDGGYDWFGDKANRPGQRPACRVLVVDDLPLFRKALVGLVQDASENGVQITEADSAEHALEILTEDTLSWTLVVTDYHMGEKTGYDLIRALRTNPAHAQLPVIVFSSDADEGNRVKCAAIPRVRWLVKRPEKEPFFGAWQELVVERKV